MVLLLRFRVVHYVPGIVFPAAIARLGIYVVEAAVNGLVYYLRGILPVLEAHRANADLAVSHGVPFLADTQGAIWHRSGDYDTLLLRMGC